MSATFELYEDDASAERSRETAQPSNGEYRWRLVHRNGNSVERRSTTSQPATAG